MHDPNGRMHRREKPLIADRSGVASDVSTDASVINVEGKRKISRLDISRPPKAVAPHDIIDAIGAAVPSTHLPKGPSRREQSRNNLNSSGHLSQQVNDASCGVDRKRSDQQPPPPPPSATNITTTTISSNQQQQPQQHHEPQNDTIPLSSTDDLTNFVLLENGIIQTPGKSLRVINQWLMTIDRITASSTGDVHPSQAAFSNYAQDIYQSWKLLEDKVERTCYQLGFPHGSNLETFRSQCVSSMLRFFRRWNCQTPWILHYGVININRIVVEFAIKRMQKMDHAMLACVTCACVRLALKHEESCKFNSLWTSINTPWTRLHFDPSIEAHLDSKQVSTIEFQMLAFLSDVLIPPSPRDFLERFIHVGRWPKSTAKLARSLASYLLDLTLVAPKMSELEGVKPSRLASASLVLAVKVVESMACKGDLSYESWPKCLEVYSGYTIHHLGQPMRGLSKLLRNKPPQAELLESFHPYWGVINWA